MGLVAWPFIIIDQSSQDSCRFTPPFATVVGCSTFFFLKSSSPLSLLCLPSGHCSPMDGVHALNLTSGFHEQLVLRFPSPLEDVFLNAMNACHRGPFRTLFLFCLHFPLWLSLLLPCLLFIPLEDFQVPKTFSFTKRFTRGDRFSGGDWPSSFPSLIGFVFSPLRMPFLPFPRCF